MSINLNYSPKVLTDTTKLSEDEWLAWRKKGIGGSDAASSMNLSPYKTARDLFLDKTSPVKPLSASSKNITFEIGHLLEETVAEIFTMKTGLTMHRDTNMYCHGLYPYMLADVDRIIDGADGEKIILECKTAHYNTMHLWADGKIPRHYELQVRHYLSVLNLDRAFIACLFSNNPDDFVWREIRRDYDEEENIIYQEGVFWNRYVLQGIEPPLVEKPEMAIESLKKQFSHVNANAPQTVIPEVLVANVESVYRLKKEKSALDAKSRELDARIKAESVPVIEYLGNTCSAECHSADSDYLISYNSVYREGFNKNAKNYLMAQYPEIYNDISETTESRILKIVQK